jgi:diguanylate cyclase (GGDEF)-like protein/PAS domain S-box-containing protein
MADEPGSGSLPGLSLGPDEIRALVDLSPDAVVVLMDGYHVFANARGLALHGASRIDELRTKPAIEYMHPSCRDVAEDRAKAVTEDNQGIHYLDEKIVRLDGTILDIEAAGCPFVLGGRPAMLVVFRDITARKQAEAELKAAQMRFESAFQHAPTGMAILDRDGRLLDANPPLAALLDRDIAVLIGAECADAVAAVDRDAVRGAFADLVAGRTPMVRGDFRYRRPDGSMGWMHGSAAGLAGSVTYVVHLLDVTASKLAEYELTRRATHDDLTGLPNRTMVLKRLDAALGGRGDGPAEPAAALFIDLNGFKRVNDTLGHAAGDALLCEVAGRLRRALRPSDTVGRLGGDEFVVVISGPGAHRRAPEVAERMLAAVAEPLLLAGTTVRVSASIGVATAHDRVVTAEQLLAEADAAMYQAKSSRDRRRRNST